MVFLCQKPVNKQTDTFNTAQDPNFIINDIFDLTEEDMLFIHRWANFFHIKTKEITLLNEAAFFQKKCNINEADLHELERHLRQRRFIRKFFELGGAAFTGAGKASGDTPVSNVNTSMLSSIGIGARLFSKQSSDAQVIHIDIIKPLSSEASVDSFEFRLSTKHSF